MGRRILPFFSAHRQWTGGIGYKKILPAILIVIKPRCPGSHIFGQLIRTLSIEMLKMNTCLMGYINECKTWLLLRFRWCELSIKQHSADGSNHYYQQHYGSKEWIAFFHLSISYLPSERWNLYFRKIITMIVVSYP